MVIAVTQPEISVSTQERPKVTAQTTPALQPSRPATEPSTECVRCGASIVMGYDEPECITCGWVDYSYTKAKTTSNVPNLISTATKYVLRYCGDFPKLAETLTYAKVVRIRNRVGYAVNCPFCHEIMEQSSLSGKRPDAREQRFRCTEGHRGSLVPTKRGMIGWR